MKAKTPAAAPPPKIEAPIKMPDPEDPIKKIEDEKRMARLVARSGREAAKVSQRSTFG